jgi:hypothetical protein
MNWEAVGAIGEIVGAIVVIASVLYLARQLQQSNKQGQAEAVRDLYQVWNEVFRHLGRDAESANLFRQGLNDYGNLTKNEKLQFHSMFCAIPDTVYMAIVLQEKGYASLEIADAGIAVLEGFLSAPGGKRYWQEVSHTFPITPYLESRSGNKVPPITETVAFYGHDE